MIDFVIRNARVAGHHDALIDIGFENGRIATVEPNLVCDAPSYDAEGSGDKTLKHQSFCTRRLARRQQPAPPRLPGQTNATA